MAKSGGRRVTATEKAAEPKYVPECYACPIGTASMALQGARPEATEHFLRAGREIVLGLKSMVDGLSELLRVMEERSASTSSVIERINIRRT